MGQGMLTEEDGIFTDICFDMTNLESFNWFISQGYLSPLIPRQTYFEFDTTGVRSQNGEYVLKDLQEKLDQKEITRRVLKEATWLAQDRKHMLFFCSGIEHAVHTAEMLNEMGIPAVSVHSKMDDAVRDRNIESFRNGDIRAITNNGILTTGFDYDRIDCIVMLRPTLSPGLWVQMLGRGTRPVYETNGQDYDLETLAGRLAAIKAGPKQNCLVLDFAGNTRRLGPINDPIIPRRKGQDGNGVAPVKVCPICGVYNHAASRFCTNCGAEFPKQVKIEEKASTAELITKREKSTPKVSIFNVYSMTYKRHVAKQSGIVSMQVTYYCGLQSYSEWWCFNHAGYARKKARDLWRAAVKEKEASVPESTEEALARIHELNQPKQIRVWTNKDLYPEVLSHVYDPRPEANKSGIPEEDSLLRNLE
jgi:DNA repair protein RadD